MEKTMGQGTLIINTKMGDGAMPIPNVNFIVLDKQGNQISSGTTNIDGVSPAIALSAPDARLTYDPNTNVLPYSIYDLWVAKNGFATVNIIDVEIFDGQQAIVPVNMMPVVPGHENMDFEDIPPPLAELPTLEMGQRGEMQLPNEGFVGTDMRQGLDTGDKAFRYGNWGANTGFGQNLRGDGTNFNMSPSGSNTGFTQSPSGSNTGWSGSQSGTNTQFGTSPSGSNTGWASSPSGSKTGFVGSQSGTYTNFGNSQSGSNTGTNWSQSGSNTNFGNLPTVGSSNSIDNTRQGVSSVVEANNGFVASPSGNNSNSGQFQSGVNSNLGHRPQHTIGDNISNFVSGVSRPVTNFVSGATRPVRNFASKVTRPIRNFIRPHDKAQNDVYIQASPADGRMLPSVVIPDSIVVHLGVPSNTAVQDIRVPFIDYIKNVTSSEIYPTWPRNAIIANVHAIVSFTLNRIYTQWYRVRGYNFDITNNTGYDQFFVPNREIFANISQIVDEIFDVYARRQGFNNPFFTEYCNGTTSTCNGLSQWGTVPLAEKGMTPLEILHYYYPSDLELTTAPSGTVEGFPGTLRQGESGDGVTRVQTYLNRISANYPAIPKITAVDGIFGSQTNAAVKAFQQTFNMTQDGIVGRATWNKISQIYSAVTKLSELEGEGERVGLSPNPPTVTIRQGNKGADTIHLQFLLNFIGDFYDDIIPPVQDSIFGQSTTDAVKAFQKQFGLSPDGIVGSRTWQMLYDVYNNLQGDINQGGGSGTPGGNAPGGTPGGTTPPGGSTPPSGGGTAPGGTAPAFPGYVMRQGNTGNDVKTLQTLINKAHTLFNAVPTVSVDGNFGPATTQSIRTFQLYSGLNVDGLVGPQTWAALAAI